MKNIKNLVNFILILIGAPIVIYLNIHVLSLIFKKSTTIDQILSSIAYLGLALVFVIIPLYYLNRRQVSLQFFLNILQKKGYESWKKVLEDYSKEIDDLRTSEFHKLGETIYRNLFKKYISNHELSEEELESLDSIFQYFQLSQDFLRSVRQREGIPILQELYDFSYEDHIFTEEEELKVMKLASALNIHREEIERLGKQASIDAYRKTVQKIVEDNRFTEEEERELDTVKKKLSIVESDWTFLGQEQKLDIYKTIYKIEKGIIPEIVPSFPLPKQEKTHLEKEASLLEYFPDERFLMNRGFIHVLKKGESYEIGRGRKSNLAATGKGRFEGNLFLTSKRILFLHKIRTFSILFDELDRVEVFRNGVCLQSKGKNYLLEFSNEDELFTYILSKLW